MKLIKKTAIAAALSAIALSASAMSPIQDADLSQVSGQDGVSIAADLHVNVGSFVYTDTDGTGGSVTFNNIKVNGTFAMTLDIINNASFQTAAVGPLSVLGVKDLTTGGLTLAGLHTIGDAAATSFLTVPANAGNLAGAEAAAKGAVQTALGAAWASGSGTLSYTDLVQASAVAGFNPKGDVVQIAIPKIAVVTGHELNMSVDSIKMGNSSASYGSFAMNDIKLQGTTVYIWAH